MFPLVSLNVCVIVSKEVQEILTTKIQIWPHLLSDPFG